MIPSRRLTAADAALVKALLRVGMAQHDVASLLCCNSGRVAEINTGERFPSVGPADLTHPGLRARLQDLRVAQAARVDTQVAIILARAAA